MRKACFDHWSPSSCRSGLRWSSSRGQFGQRRTGTAVWMAFTTCCPNATPPASTMLPSATMSTSHDRVSGTVGLLAGWDKSDQWHQAAHVCFAELQTARAELLSTTFVLLECGNAAARRPYRDAVFRLRENMESSKR